MPLHEVRDPTWWGPDQYWGISRERLAQIDASLLADLQRLHRRPEAEIRADLQALGFVLCACTGVDRGDRYLMIYNPNCPIHHLERRRG